LPTDSFKGANLSYCFYNAKCLRKIPAEIIELTKLENSNGGNNLIYPNGFGYCYALDEIIGLGAPVMSGKMTINRFNYLYSLLAFKTFDFRP